MNLISFSHTYRLIVAIAMMMFCIYSPAQNGGGKSSYSRFGLGLLNDQAQTWNKTMGGVGVALPSSNRLNTLNPASYAYMDSLTFILDVGMSGNFGRMSSAIGSTNVNSANFDYLVAGFRLRKNLSISFGFKPYTTVSYDYTTESAEMLQDETTGEWVHSKTQYTGSGGLNNVFVGLGWRPFGHFAIGANIGILWGGYDHLTKQGFLKDNTSSSDFNGLYLQQIADVLTYKLDFGAQYAFRVSPKDWFTLGTTIGIGHSFGGDADLYRYIATSTTQEPTATAEGKAFDIPMTYAFGIAWQHKNNLMVSLDAHYQSWGKCRIPVMSISDGTVSYPGTQGMYQNSYMLKAGAEYTPNPLAHKNYFKRVKYRAGISYSSPHMNISSDEGSNAATQEGPSELAVTLGFGLPISSRYNRYLRTSSVNLGMQWLRRASSEPGLITENYFVLNLGVTFNERWFQKYKID